MYSWRVSALLPQTLKQNQGIGSTATNTETKRHRLRVSVIGTDEITEPASKTQNQRERERERGGLASFEGQSASKNGEAGSLNRQSLQLPPDTTHFHSLDINALRRTILHADAGVRAALCVLLKKEDIARLLHGGEETFNGFACQDKQLASVDILHQTWFWSEERKCPYPPPLSPQNPKRAEKHALGVGVC